MHNKVAAQSILRKGSEQHLLIYFPLFPYVWYGSWQLVSCQEMIATAHTRRGFSDDWHFSLSGWSTAVPFSEVMEKAGEEQVWSEGESVLRHGNFQTHVGNVCQEGRGIRQGDTRHLQTS